MSDVAVIDPHDVRRSIVASGLLEPFNEAGVLVAADLHVARRLCALRGEERDEVLLATAFAVRAPRLGHVHVDLAAIRETAAVDAEDEVDLSELPWPEPEKWVDSVRSSSLLLVRDEKLEPVPALRLEESRLYLERYWREEVQIADDLIARAAPTEDGVDDTLLEEGLRRLFGEDPQDRQAAAARSAARRRLTVIAGGPGTGKTTTVARILALLFEQSRAAGARTPLVGLAAPTGKAAARLQEAVRHDGATLDTAVQVRELLATVEASTLHRLLGWRPGTASRFRHHRLDRLPHDVVVVDETSMVSLTLMARLLEAVRLDARLILVGDPEQLRSIEAGAVLGDIVGPAGRPGNGPLANAIVVLDRVHRFSGAIADLATAIRAGDADAAVATLRAEGTNVTWIESEVATPDTDQLETVRKRAVASATAVFEAAQAGDAVAALEQLGAFRILCAHRRGPDGVSRWIDTIESWLTAAVPGFATASRWYVGRPLLVTQNDYELQLSNGDTGVIVQRDDGRLGAAFERGGGTVTFSPTRLGPVETVYAMTVHKGQGSQFHTAAVLLPAPESRILTRELLYTAVTRAQEELIVVGTEETVRAAIDRPIARASGLAARLSPEPASPTSQTHGPNGD